MFQKTLTTDFFSTINLPIALRTLLFLTFKIRSIRFGTAKNLLEIELLSYIDLPQSKIISFYNGRSAIYHALKLIELKEKDEVIVSGYTCISVVNSVLQSGAKIVYCDIDTKNLGLDTEHLQKIINKNTRAIIIQHTFGKPASIEKIKKIISKEEKNILLIEDCAHALGSRIDGKKLGGFGDFSILSTGRDKVISSVNGGFLIVNNPKYFSKVENIEINLKMPPRSLVLKNLIYNMTAYKAYKFYDFFNLGKIIMLLAKKLHLIPTIITPEEKKCEFKNFDYKLPNSLAYLASKELEKIKFYSHGRQLIAQYYDEYIHHPKIKPIFSKEKNEKNNAYRYPILMKDSEAKNELYEYMKQHGIYLGNYWSGQNIVPPDVNLNHAQYVSGTCKNAEKISSRILTLPNHYMINIDDVVKVVDLLNNFGK